MLSLDYYSDAPVINIADKTHSICLNFKNKNSKNLKIPSPIPKSVIDSSPKNVNINKTPPQPPPKNVAISQHPLYPLPHPPKIDIKIIISLQ